MLDQAESSRALKKLFGRDRSVDMKRLFQKLETRSRMSVFRRLKEVGYFSSYTHTGRYYTLEAIPVFDDQGLWFHRGVGFSRWGTLKATIIHFAEEAEAGKTHRELVELLKVRVQNALLALVREKRIGRQPLDKSFLYVSADEGRGREQVDKRREHMKRAEQTRPLTPALVIEVLIEVIQAAGVIVAPSVVVGRLSQRGLAMTLEQVEAVYREHHLEPEKKTAPSRPSRT